VRGNLEPREISSLMRHMLVYGGGILLGKATGFIMIPIYTRALTRADYGVLELLTRSAEVASIVLALGMSSAVLRFYFDHDDQRDRDLLVSSAFAFSVLLALGATALLSVFAGKLSRVLFGTPEHQLLVLLLIVTNLFELTSVVPMAYIRAQERSLHYSLVNVIRLVVGISLNIYLVVVLRLGLLGVLYSGLVSGGIIAAWLTVYSVRQTGLKFSLSKLEPMLRYGAPLIPATLCMFVLHSADRFFLQHYAGLDEVGLYALSYRFAMVLPVLILQPFGLAFMPMVYAIARRPGAGMVYARTLTYLTVVTTWLALGMALVTRDVLRVMSSPEYLDAYRPLPMIAFGFVFLGMQGTFEIGIHIQKRTVFRLVNVASAALVSLVLCWVLIPRYGMMGAAAATFGSFLWLAAVSYAVSQRLYPIRYDFPRLAHIFVVAGALYALGALFVRGDGVGLVVARILLGLSFPAWLWATGFARDEEKATLARMLLRRRAIPIVTRRVATTPPPSADPLVSVIIATYNYGHLIERSVDSLLSQDYRHLEIIVVDDGSTDNTQAVLERYRGRLRYVRCEHRGAAAARNSGLEVAGGDYIAFLDADDILLPHSIRRRVAFLESQPDLDVVFGDVEVARDACVVVPSFLRDRSVFRSIPRMRVAEGAYVLPERIFDYVVRERFITVPSVLIRRRTMDHVGRFDETFNKSQDDYDLWLRLAREARLGYLDSLLARCFIHGANMSNNTILACHKRIELMHKLLRIYPDLTPTTRRLIARRLGEQHFAVGYMYFAGSKLLEARAHFAQARRHSSRPARMALYHACTALRPETVELLRLAKRRVVAAVRGDR